MVHITGAGTPSTGNGSSEYPVKQMLPGPVAKTPQLESSSMVEQTHCHLIHLQTMGLQQLAVCF